MESTGEVMDEKKIQEGVRLILEGIGEDCTREGLLETPDRIARMYQEIFGGMGKDAKEHLSKTFHVKNNEMVVEKDIVFYSTCEHHLAPVLWKGTCCLYSGWKSGRFKQVSKNRRSLCEKTTDAGTAYRTDRGCADGAFKTTGGNGHDRSRAYVYDDAWY